MYQHDLCKYISYRELLENDLEDILLIERDAYEFPWSEQIFRDCLCGNYMCIGVSMYEKLAGYMIVSQILDEAHLLNICLSKDWRGNGLGGYMLDYLVSELNIKKVKRLFLEVRPTNLVALALYNRKGFEIIGLRKDYYPAKGGREDAITMLLNI